MNINGKEMSEPEVKAMIKAYVEEIDRLNLKYKDLLREIQPVLRAAFFAHFEQTNKANEIYDRINKLVGKE